MKEILCESCSHWIDCGTKDNKPYGYCVMEDLYTYTARKKCPDYCRGEPVKEEELETVK